MEIKHIFNYTAAFEDGSVIEFDKDKEGDDVAQLTEEGSRFTDVMTKSKESPLISFVLHNDEMSVGVDLRDGHFELNGIPFFQHRPDLDGYKDFRVIYYRTVLRTMSQVTGEEIQAGIRNYGIGWQVTHKGENVQRVMII